MNAVLRSTLALAISLIATHAVAQVTLYEHEGFGGRSFTTHRPVRDLDRLGFNDRASSVVIDSERWELCDDARFRGRCVVLRPGRYPSLAAIGLSDRVSSVRYASRDNRAENDRYPPPPAPPPAPPAAVAQATFYEHEDFRGRSFTADGSVGDFRRSGFDDRASSVVITGERSEVCESAQFSGRCAVLPPGRYASLAAMGLDDRVSSVRVGADVRHGNVPVPLPTPVSPQVTFYEHEGFVGRSFTSDTPVEDFRRQGFNDRASSAVVLGGPWEVCDDARFGGRCTVLRVGRYPSLAAMGLDDRVSSVRTVGIDAKIDERRHAPPPQPVYDSRRRREERLYDANVTSVRAVMGRPEQRCWVEQEAVAPEKSRANVPGAIIGAVLGGVLGHQVGGGRGKDIATAGGAVAGAVMGSQVGRASSAAPATQDVQRCANTPADARPDYFDVTYQFRGVEHRVQMTTAPGPTVVVNEQGEPRT